MVLAGYAVEFLHRDTLHGYSVILGKMYEPYCKFAVEIFLYQ